MRFGFGFGDDDGDGSWGLVMEFGDDAAVHIDKPLPPKHNTLTTHQQGQVGHNVEHQKHLSYIIMLGIMEMKGMLEMSLSRGPHSTSVFMRGYSRRLIPATKPSSILRSPMIRGGKRNIELQAQAMVDLLPAEFHNNGNLLCHKAPHPTKTRPQDNSKLLTLSEKKRKEAALGRQRAHARADTSEMNRVAMDDPTDGLRWAFYLTLSGLWDSFLPSPTSQAPYIAFEFLKHWPSPLESNALLADEIENLQITPRHKESIFSELPYNQASIDVMETNPWYHVIYTYILLTRDLQMVRVRKSTKTPYQASPTGRTETLKQYKRVRKSNSFQGYSLGSRALGCEIGQAARPPRSQRMLRRTSDRRTPTYQN
ncbi:hypothetical protein NOF04DRAFT_6202 [Fusarium oxysporum II5]|uniref:Uncharacterized protein n=1 Tax=Fusarium odoratissimum (strain NRRL 54006) TaxID=1089451 RepID=X0JQN9_FUSO5|nr:uncharacterized protein FOIG_09396 [Fusarium odoratissimum NRRL 54006]EXL98650.1 hypothetical protein FOIG_09396 [Fusarium odoratissimum NRRL 54006]KAK2129285.1 hypothetical protein NOF04DRAFT_6202 [Fusarium oxysporum II5]